MSLAAGRSMMTAIGTSRHFAATQLGAMPAMSVRSWQLTDLNRPAGFEQRIPGQHGFRVIETVGSHTNVPGKVSRH